MMLSLRPQSLMLLCNPRMRLPPRTFSKDMQLPVGILLCNVLPAIDKYVETLLVFKSANGYCPLYTIVDRLLLHMVNIVGDNIYFSCMSELPCIAFGKTHNSFGRQFGKQKQLIVWIENLGQVRLINFPRPSVTEG